MTITRQAFDEWMAYVLAKRYINVDGAHGAQCWDLFAHFCDWFGIPRVNTYGGKWSGWAGALVDQYWANGAAANFDLIGPSEPAQVGDTAVWGDSYWYYPKTHVAQVYADAGALLLCVSQNSSASQADNPYPGESTGPSILQHLPKQGLIGYLRPRGSIAYQGSTTPSEEDDLAYTQEELSNIVVAAVEKVMMESRKFNGNRNMIDAINQGRTDTVSVGSKVEALTKQVTDLPQAILFDTRVDGRNVMDNFKQTRIDLFATRSGGNIDVAGLAASIAELLEAKDVADLAARLQITAKEG